MSRAGAKADGHLGPKSTLVEHSMRLACAMAAVALAFVALCVAVPAQAHAQSARVTVKADRTAIDVSGEVLVTVRMEGKFSNHQTPNLDDFEVLGQQRTQMFDGRGSSVVLQLTLRPKRAGTLTIGPAKLFQGGRLVAKSDPVAIKATKPRPPEPVSAAEARQRFQQPKGNLSLHASVKRDSYYIGEAFPIVWQLVAKPKVRITSLEMADRPRLDGLLVEDIRAPTAQFDVQQRRLGRKNYNVVTVAEMLATPLEVGPVLIDMSSARVGVADSQRRSFLQSSRRTAVKSQPFMITIKPLPTEGKPEGFSNSNIGVFSIATALKDEHGQQPQELRTGQRMILTLDVRGRGNLLGIKAPKLASDDNFDVQELPGIDKDKVVKDSRGVTGLRTFQYILTAVTPGTHEVPTVRFDYFNPERGRYEQRVQKGPTVKVTGNAISGDKSSAELTGEDVGPIITGVTLDSGSSSTLPRSWWYWLALGVPALLFVLVEVRHRLQSRDANDPLRRRSRSAFPNAKKRLKAAERAQQDGLVKDFYGQIGRTLTGYLEERANIPATGMTHDQVRAACSEAGYPAALVDAVVVEMENCDFARFAPSGSSGDKLRATLERTDELLKKLDAVTPKRRP